jgi:acetylornithine/succinyldiaminopimelate/putrescine aminotransferase
MPSDLSPHLLGQGPVWPIEIVRGRNDRVWDREGRVFYDFYGGHAVALTGHAHSRIRRAINREMRKLIFYSTSTRLNVRERAAATLAAHLPDRLSRMFFCNSGAEANENALKIALRLTGRERLIAFRGSFHGRTALTLAVTDDPRLNGPFARYAPRVDWLPFAEPATWEGVDFHKAAAVILEPIQSMGGVRVAPDAWLGELIARAHAAGCLVIFDEIQTGLGRTGTWFCASRPGLEPDMVTLAKGLASGIPVAATIVTADIASALEPHDLGSTFGGGPVAMAALLATFEVLEREDCLHSVREISQKMMTAINPLPGCAVLGRGFLLGIKGPRTGRWLCDELFSRGFLAGPSRDPLVTRLLPPLTLRPRSADRFLDALSEILGEAG